MKKVLILKNEINVLTIIFNDDIKLKDHYEPLINMNKPIRKTYKKKLKH